MAAFTLGASEALTIPSELALLGYRSVVGQEMRVHYAMDQSIDYFYVEPGLLDFGLGHVDPHWHLRDETPSGQAEQ